MKLSLLIAELRRRCPTFEGRVYGAAEWAAQDKINMAIPSAFVLPLGETAEMLDMSTDYRQRVEQAFGVALLVSTDLSDPTGVRAFDVAEDLKAEVFRAILGWEADETAPITYEGSSVLELNRAFLCVQLEFVVVYDIVDEETRHGVSIEELPDFAGVDVDVDTMTPDGKTEASMKINLE